MGYCIVMMKVLTANVNGIRSAHRKGFFAWLQDQNADFICLQETKAQLATLSHDISHMEGYHLVYSDAVKKGYSGVCIYSKRPPCSVSHTLGETIFDTEGRFVEARFEHLSVVSLYLPSGTSGPERQAIKMRLLDYFYQGFLTEAIEGTREVIICGDWNIAHTQKDLKNWQQNQKNSGFLPEERAWLDKVFAGQGWVDAFRVLNKEPDEYTWWSFRANARANNVGWRIDYQVVTPGIAKKLRSVSVYKDQVFSDHAPLIMEYDYVLGE